MTDFLQFVFPGLPVSKEKQAAKEIMTLKMEFVSDEQRKAVFANISDRKSGSSKYEIKKEELKAWKPAQIDRTIIDESGGNNIKIVKTDGFTNGKGLGIYKFGNRHWVITHQGTGLSIGFDTSTKERAAAIATIISNNYDFSEAEIVSGEYIYGPGTKELSSESIRKLSGIISDVMEKTDGSRYNPDKWADKLIENAK